MGNSFFKNERKRSKKLFWFLRGRSFRQVGQGFTFLQPEKKKKAFALGKAEWVNPRRWCSHSPSMRISVGNWTWRVRCVTMQIYSGLTISFVKKKSAHREQVRQQPSTFSAMKHHAFLICVLRYVLLHTDHFIDCFVFALGPMIFICGGGFLQRPQTHYWATFPMEYVHASWSH